MGDLADLLGGLRILDDDVERRAPGRGPPPGRGGRGSSEGGQALVIGGVPFSGSKAAWDHIESVKQRLLGQYIGETDPDFEFLAGLLARHPKGPAKVDNPPVRQFTAHRNSSGRGIEFHFVDDAGEEHDFSAKKCMEGKDFPGWAKLGRAMELAVADVAHSRCSGATACALCGATDVALVPDHDNPTFPQLRSNFQRSCHLAAPTEFAESAMGGAEFRPEDDAFVAAWRRYHAAHARLRALCAGCLAAEHRRRGINPKSGGQAFWGGRGRGRGRGRAGQGGRGGRGDAGRRRF